MKKGFTLVEMLVVIGIIAILMGASIGGFSSMTRSAEKTRAQELVSNVATALTALYQQEGNWPKSLAGNNGGKDGELTAVAALPLAKGKFFSLTTDSPSNPSQATKLMGLDKFGILSPWGTAIVKRKGTSASEGDVKPGEKDYRLHYALDLDGDGLILGANVGGRSIDVRATAIVWCSGKDGIFDPYPYGKGGGSGQAGGNSKNVAGKRSDDVYSWTPGQTQDVK